ncbi:uncharacterized protein LY89DRAFT_734568 [Mollisia scopiformis]|uniref:Uncharacterized protein n=1 Tax=Mollisia scopiformis TaxID=149040 RepID=A0A194X8G9_MOLSC|nr:uncharacterized protein LY89DRAFT_734568 [Mollisia scopiformis]KUJ16468.1 hypothetical protein LY89DRAFT_734568 [Mollisia scopiformis]
MDELPQYYWDEDDRIASAKVLQVPHIKSPSNIIIEYASDTEDCRQMITIFERLIGSANPSHSPEEAAHAVTCVYSDELKSYFKRATKESSVVRFKDGFLWGFYHLIFDYSKQVDGMAQTKLVQFVDAFRKMPRTAKTESNVEWCDLGKIGWAARDTVDRFPVGGGEVDKRTQQIQELRFHAFIARLATESTLDFSSLAYFYFRDALENVPDPRSKAYHTQGPLLEETLLIPA